MRALIVMLVMATSVSAWAKFSARQGCGSESVEVAKESVERMEKIYNSGLSTGIDVIAAKIHLAEARYCAGDSTYSTENYCDKTAEDSKAKLLNDLLAVRTKLWNAGSLLSYVVDDTKKEISQFQEFCESHIGKGND